MTWKFYFVAEVLEENFKGTVKCCQGFLLVFFSVLPSIFAKPLRSYKQTTANKVQRTVLPAATGYNVDVFVNILLVLSIFLALLYCPFVPSVLCSWHCFSIRWSRVTWGCLTGWYLILEIIMCVGKMSAQEISSKESQMLKSDSLSFQQQTRLDIPLTLSSPRLFTCFSMADKHLSIQLRIFYYIGIVFSRCQLLKHNLFK